MKFQREHTDDGVSITVTTSSGLDSDIETPVEGTIKIEAAEGVEPPLNVRTRVPDNYYVDIVGESKILDISELPVEFDFRIEPSKERESMVVLVEGEAGTVKEVRLRLRPAQVINIGNKILSDESEVTDEEILNNIGDYYGTRGSLVFSDLRGDIRNHIGFKQYYSILDFLYEIDPHEDAEEHLIRSFEKHIVSENNRSNHGEYHPESNSEFNEMLEFYSGLDNLPSFSENKISEFKGFINEKFAKQAALSGDFDSAKNHLETSISHFENVGRTEVKEPAEIKQIALEGLIKEAEGKFKEAKQDYETAADELAAVDRLDDGDAEVYEVWAQLTEVKHNLANGNHKTAVDIFESISGGHYVYSLVDLTKLNVLVELLEDLENDKTSHGSRTFGKAEMPASPGKATDEYDVTRDLIVQYETDYSSAYSVLLSKQQLKKLGHDSIDDKSLNSAIVDGITPLGNESSPSKKSNNDADNMVGELNTKSSSGLSKTNERSKDRTFDALNEENDETISYESQVNDTQEGRYHHEEAIDILEDYLDQHGFKGGETNRSDLISTDGENVLLVEAKHISSNKEATQIREAVGQLLEYRYRDILQDDEFSELDLTLWLLLAQPPNDTYKQILDSYRDKGIYTLWIQNDEISGLEESLTKLEQIAGKSTTTV